MTQLLKRYYDIYCIIAPTVRIQSIWILDLSVVIATVKSSSTLNESNEAIGFVWATESSVI